MGINPIHDPSSPNYQLPLTPQGNASVKVRSGRSWRRLMRIERAVRLELSGLYNSKEIALNLGIEPITLHQLKKTPEYLATRIKLTSGVISEYDKELLTNIEACRGQLQELMPQALLTLRNNLIKGNSSSASFQERRLATSIAQDVLDRDKDASFSKVSKTQISIKPQESLADWDNDAKTLSAILSMNSHASRTLNMEETGHASFSHAALDKNAQTELQKNVKVNDFNVSKIADIESAVDKIISEHKISNPETP